MNKISALAIAIGMAFTSQANKADLFPIGSVENDITTVNEVNDIRSYTFSDLTRINNLNTYTSSKYSYGACITLNQYTRYSNDIVIKEEPSKLRAVNRKLDCMLKCGGVVDVDRDTKYTEEIEKDKKDKKESEDGKGEEEEKDTSILGIGDVKLDTTTKTVMIDDTIIYEEFEIIIKEDVVNDEHNEEPYYAEKGMTPIRSLKTSRSVIVGGTPVPSNTDQANAFFNGYKDDSEPIEFNPVVFPNPATSSETINIKLDSDIQSHIEIFDMSGRQVKVLDNTVENIEIGQLQTGTYFVIIKDGNGNSTSKKLLVK